MNIERYLRPYIALKHDGEKPGGIIFSHLKQEQDLLNNFVGINISYQYDDMVFAGLMSYRKIAFPTNKGYAQALTKLNSAGCQNEDPLDRPKEDNTIFDDFRAMGRLRTKGKRRTGPNSDGTPIDLEK